MAEPWQLPPLSDRMRVNAALTTLTESFDYDAAREVIAAFRSLPADESYPHQYGTKSIVPDSDELIIQTHDGPRQLACIGSHEVFRIEQRDCLPCVVIRQLWSPEIGDVPEGRPDELHLVYRSVANIPIALFRYRWRMTKPSLLDRVTCLIRLRTLAPVTVWGLALADTIFVANGYAPS